MKKISILILAFITLTGLNSCSADDDVVFIAQPDPEGINFMNDFSSAYILTPATADNTAERFVWNELDLDVPTNIVYEVQASTTQSFDEFTVLGSTPKNNLAIKVRQLLSLANDAGLDNDPNTEAPNTGTIFVRVVASAGTAGEIAHTSEVKALTVMLPEVGDEEEPIRYFYLVGNATAAGWDPNNNNTPLFRDPEDPNMYYFTGRFAEGEFKLLEVLGQWQPQWGLQDGELTSSVILGGDPGAFTVPATGYYQLTLNAEDMTYTFEEVDVASAPVYSTIGFLGSATPTGWDSDTDFMRRESNPHIWFANDVTLAEGEMKFRAGDAWDVNWGSDTPLTGQATMNGPNIPVAEGVYDIWFNDLTGRYILIPQEVEE